MNAVEAIVKKIGTPDRGATAPAFVLALDGHSAAGKSTIAAELAARIDAALIHADDFYRDLSHEDRLALTPEQGVDSFFDWERLRGEALLPLRERTQACFRRFDWKAGEGLISDLVVVDPRAVVIIEGVYAARPEFEDLLDLKVLVQTPARERERRRRERHDPHLWWERWDAAERHYFKESRCSGAFDLVVTGHA